MAPETPPRQPPFEAPAEETQRAFLFHCSGDEDLHAISLDPAAGNIPALTCQTRWLQTGEIIVGVQEVLPLALNPEPVLRGLRNVGYYVWKTPAAPTSTTQ